MCATQNYQNQNRHGGRQGNKQKPCQLPKCTYNFYKDSEKTKIDPELISKTAKDDIAEVISRNDTTKNQIRRFYDEIKRLEQRCADSSYEVVEPHLKMLKARAFYSSKSKNAKIPMELKQFLENLVDSINDEKDLKAAALLFEAVVGYHIAK